MFGPQSFSLAGRRALVTGGSRGLGQAIALALGRMGAEVCVTSRSTGALDGTLELLAAEKIVAKGVAFDVRDVAAINSRIDALVADWPVDILVNNAGFESVSPSAYSIAMKFCAPTSPSWSSRISITLG